MSAKTILVTGGNRSIGFGIVKRLAQRSSVNNIIIASRQKDHAENSISELQSMGFKSPFHAISLELTDDDSIRKAVSEVDQKFGKLDGMCVNLDFS
jgi:NAD(P)-dependent dehydrogenase (short-subunit alcohol dehydrogenase family)